MKAAASCSAEHFQNLQDQFFSRLREEILLSLKQTIQLLGVFFFLSGLQKRLTSLPPTLRSMKTDYASLRSQVRNFSEFYGAAINEAKKQVSHLAQALQPVFRGKVHLMGEFSGCALSLADFSSY